MEKKEHKEHTYVEKQYKAEDKKEKKKQTKDKKHSKEKKEDNKEKKKKNEDKIEKEDQMEEKEKQKKHQRADASDLDLGVELGSRPQDNAKQMQLPQQAGASASSEDGVAKTKPGEGLSPIASERSDDTQELASSLDQEPTILSEAAEGEVDASLQAKDMEKKGDVENTYIEKKE